MSIESERERKWNVLACAGILFAVLALYWPVANFEFINYDDPDYVLENQAVRNGLTPEGVRWAFTAYHAANWHPLTWMSHMLDVSLWGMNAGAHHLTSVVLHAFAAILLFITLRFSTRSFGASFFVALAWAIHPLRVESVAWVAERKDVLAGVFCFATTATYVLYAQSTRRRTIWYALTCACFALGLLSKPTLVTLPFAILLLDSWPLNRIDLRVLRSRSRTVVLEKLPMLALSLAASVATLMVQSSGSAITQALVPLPQRLFNASASVASYLRCTFAPYDLGVHYPHPYMGAGIPIPLWQIVGSIALMIAATAFAAWRVRLWPFLMMGWLWFLGTLLPMSGLVQVGIQARADRYTYIPAVGILVAATWFTSAVVRRSQMLRVIGVITLVGLSYLTSRQLAHWQSSITLMSHSARVAPNSFVAFLNLGAAYEKIGDLPNAERAYRRTLELVPENGVAMSNLGSLLTREGRLQDAFPILDTAVRRYPTFPGLHVAMADWYSRSGDFESARTHFEEAIQLDPQLQHAFHNYALSLAERGDIEAAITKWKSALAIDPDYADALDGLGRALLVRGDVRAGQSMLRRAISIKPTLDHAMYTLAWSLATSPEGSPQDRQEALLLAARAVKIAPGHPLYLDAYAAALAQSGRYDEAAAVADQAADSLLGAQRPETSAVRRRADLYRAHQVYVQPR